MIAEVRENVLFLQELGVAGIEADLAVLQSSKKISLADADRTGDTRQTQVKYAPPPAQENKQEETRQEEKKDARAGSPSLREKLATAKLSRFSAPGSSATEPGTVKPAPSFSEKNQMDTDVPKSAESLFGDISASNELAPSEETLEGIHSAIDGCRLCRLHEGRTKIVNSTGNPQAKLMFIGEAPGADEDAQGKPFVGRAGQLLTKIIEAMGLARDDVFIGNINRCRPPGNRAPQADEVAMCKPFLLREIAVVRPKVIVVLGNTAMQNLLEVKTPIGKLRGNFQDYFGIKVMPTFHPAYLLRDPHKKREVWEDMKKVKAALENL